MDCYVVKDDQSINSIIFVDQKISSKIYIWMTDFSLESTLYG